jgi:hypothetical protein
MSVDLEAMKRRARSWCLPEIGAYDLAQDVTALVVEVESLRALLRDMEWRGEDAHGDDVCPACGAERETWVAAGADGEDVGPRRPVPGRHAPSCRLAAALKDA